MPTLTENTFTLFVILPSQKVCTLRHLVSGISVTDLKCNLELMAGFPAHIYRLEYPDGEMLEDKKRLLMKKTVDDGYVLRVVLEAEWESLCQAVLQDNVELAYSELCQGGVPTVDHVDRASCALYMASYRGQIRMCNMLISVGANVNWKSQFGRTSIHAAVSADCVCILELLASKGAAIDTEDALWSSPSRIAVIHGSTLCSKKLRLMQLNLRGKSAHARASERMVARPPRIPSEPIRRSQNLPSDNWRRPTTVHVSFPGVGDVPRTKSSLDKHINIVGTNSHQSECKHSSTSGFFAPNHHDMYFERAKNFSRGQDKRQLSQTDDSGNVLFGKQLTILRSKRVLKFGSEDDLGNARSHTPGSLRSESCVTPALTIRNKSSLSINSEHYGKENDTGSGKSNNDKKPSKYVRFSNNERYWTIFPRSNTNMSSESIKRKIHLVAGTKKSHLPPQTSYKYGDSHRAWLKKKNVLERKLEPDCCSSDESDGNDEDNKEAFKNWIENKKHPPESKRHVTGNRPIHGIITIGSTEVGNATQPDPSFNIRAYKEWLGRRKQHGPKSHRMRTMQDFMSQKRKLEEKRQQLLLTAVSYDEWLEHTGEKQALIRQILNADLNQLRVIEERELHKRAKAYSVNGQVKAVNTDSGPTSGQDKEALGKDILRCNVSVHRLDSAIKIKN